jgi:hypothetical protein
MAADTAAPDPVIPDPVTPDTWPVGTAVRLRQRPTYLKTADPLPMLRPADLVGVEEVGQVVEQRALGQIAVRFRRGTYLLEGRFCEAVPG